MSQNDLLGNVYDRERTHGDKRWMTQPLGGGPLRTFTWKEGMDEARRIASYIKSLGLPPGSNIALCSKNTAWWIFCDVAIWMAGHVSVPIYPTLNAKSVREILEHSGAKHLFVGKLDAWHTMKPGVPSDVAMISMPLAAEKMPTDWADLVKNHQPIEERPRPTGDTLATIVYTSDSTGTPKGVMLTFGAMEAAMKSADGIFHATTADRMISYLPLAHVFERAVVECNTLHYGVELFFAEALDTFVEDLKRARPTLFISVPRLWLKFQAGVQQKLPPAKLDKLLKIPVLSGIIKKKVLTGLGLDAVRMALSGSAPLPPDVLQWYRKLGLQLLEGYGMSENFCISHISKPGRVKPGYVGEPWPGVKVRISPEGEVQMKCDALMKGYYKAPDITKEVFTDDGFLRTGDRGELDSEGRLKITGRTKDLFKTSKGKYVAPVPLENILLANEYLESGCVMGSAQPQPCAVVTIAEAYRPKLDDTLRKQISDSLEKTRKAINDQVDPHEALQVVVVVDDLWTIENGTLTPTMKVKRAVVEERYTPQLGQWYASSSKTTVIWASTESASKASAQAAE